MIMIMAHLSLVPAHSVRLKNKVWYGFVNSDRNKNIVTSTIELDLCMSD